MSERYSKLFSLPENLYVLGSPIVIKAGALLKDNENNLLIAQLKLHNISNKAIKLVKVDIHCLDSVGRTLDAAITYEYLDLHVMRGTDFGSQKPIKISNSATRAYTVTVREVAFADNSIWSNTDGTLASMFEQESIHSFISDKDTLCGYQMTFGKDATHIAKRHGDLWLCTCGAINHSEEACCHKCNAAIAELESLDFKALQREGIYSTSLALLCENNIESVKRAKEKLESIGDYKDASDLIIKCNEKIQNHKGRQKKKKQTIILIPIISCAVILLGLLGYFVAYPLLAQANGNYKVIINMYDIKEFKVPDGTTKIKDEAFRGCDYLTSVTIPNSVTSIGNDAFYNCQSLVSVTIPDSVTIIGGGAFAYCLNLTNVTMSNSVTSIGNDAFLWCFRLTSITIPDSVTSIGDSAFKECSSLTSITVGNGVASIGDWAFGGCSALTDITIPNSVTSIGSYAFMGCKGLTNIIIPDNVTSIGDGAFLNCSKLTSITIPFVGATKNGTQNTHFGYIFGAYSDYDNADYVPTSLETVIVTGGSKINRYAFFDCSYLTSITIPDSVTDIGVGAFYDCNSVYSLTFEGTVTQWHLINKSAGWDREFSATKVICSNGTYPLKFE